VTKKCDDKQKRDRVRSKAFSFDQSIQKTDLEKLATYHGYKTKMYSEEQHFKHSFEALMARKRQYLNNLRVHKELTDIVAASKPINSQTVRLWGTPEKRISIDFKKYDNTLSPIRRHRQKTK
jgi:hypothetical protein